MYSVWNLLQIFKYSLHIFCRSMKLWIWIYPGPVSSYWNCCNLQAERFCDTRPSSAGIELAPHKREPHKRPSPLGHARPSDHRYLIEIIGIYVVLDLQGLRWLIESFQYKARLKFWRHSNIFIYLQELRIPKIISDLSFNILYHYLRKKWIQVFQYITFKDLQINIGSKR